MKTIQHSIALDPRGFLHIKIVGDSDADIAQQFSAAVRNFLTGLPGHTFPLFVDMTDAGTAAPEAQKIFGEELQNPRFSKLAFVHVSSLAAFFAKLTVGYSKKKDVQFFNDTQEAIAWLLN